jgi:dTDP-glucose pyrophosphorylase
MKVVILAAGKGTRMLPLTKEVPKVLIEVNGKPFLYYVLKNLQEAGFNEFVLVVGYMKEKISAFLDEFGFKAKLVEQKEQLGTGDALLSAKGFCGNEDFIMLGGDNLWDVDDFKKFNVKDKLNYISGVEVDELDSKYGVLVSDNGMLNEIKEKPLDYHGNLINAGLYKFTSDIWTALDKVKVSVRGEVELTDAINLLAKDKKVKILEAKWWIDLGSKEDIKGVQEFLEDYWEE